MNVDLTECDRERIHLPGAIQPHGVLIAMREPDLGITHASLNLRELLQVDAGEALGRPLDDVLGEAACRVVRAALEQPQPERTPLTIEKLGHVFDAVVHRHRGATILELESRGDEGPVSTNALLREALGRIQAARNHDELAAMVVEHIRQLTGFDRVMAYRFSEDDHGEVIGEARAPDVESFLGLHYPASDIPWQARALYASNWVRLIPDVEYTPVKIVPGAGADDPRPLDLSHAVLRSVSPVHIEYLRNMKVRASMSVSIVQEHRLRGLIACHHREPRHVPLEVRAACELLGRITSLEIAAFEQLDAKQRLEALRMKELILDEAMRTASAEPTTALLAHGEALLRLVGATGGAIRDGGGLHLLGAAPERTLVEGLVGWLERAGTPVLSTRALCRLYPPAHDYMREASGLLAISIPTRPPAFVLWFRPELPQSVSWAGDPSPPQIDPVDHRIRPRRSFVAWKELVTGQSAPWTAEEIEVATDLRRRAVEADLGRQVRRAESAVEVRDELIAVVSHDLRNPLNVILMGARLLASRAQDPAVDRISRAAENMDRLIADLLDLAKVEGGRFVIAPRATAAKALVEEGISLIEAIAEQKCIRLDVSAADVPVRADPRRVLQVLSNLLGNAIKFTPAGGTIKVRVEPEGEWVRFTVSDSGPGISPSDLPHVFERYWQGRGVAHGSAGLGLYIAKGIVQAHRGRIWVESQLGTGTTFHFMLPGSSRGEP